MRCPRLTLLLLVLIAAGCQWLVPLGPARDSAARDTAADGPHLDRPWPDRPADAVRRPETSRPPDRATDGCLDRLALDQSVGAPCPQIGSCLECQPVTNADCSKPCCYGDCDDLPDYRDPWKSKCNQLVFFDDFCDPTLPKWSQQTGVDVVEPGLLQIIDPPSYTYWVGVNVAAARGGLVETRLHGITGDERWEFWVSADGSTPKTLPAGTYRMCQVKWDANQLTLSSDVHVPNGSSQGGVVALPTGAQGIVVQSWLEGQAHRCRAIVPGYPPFDVTDSFTGAFPVANTAIAVGILNAYPSTATGKVDWVRAFAP
jgi:hypothetical protein